MIEGVSGAAARAGVQAGDLLLAIDGEPVTTVAQVGHARGPRRQGCRHPGATRRKDAVFAFATGMTRLRGRTGWAPNRYMQTDSRNRAVHSQCCASSASAPCSALASPIVLPQTCFKRRLLHPPACPPPSLPVQSTSPFSQRCPLQGRKPHGLRGCRGRKDRRRATMPTQAALGRARAGRVAPRSRCRHPRIAGSRQPR